MKRAITPALCLGLLAVGPPEAFSGDECRHSSVAAPSPRELYHQLPLHFEANTGQADPRARFLARGSGYALFLTPRESVLVLRGPNRDGKGPSAEVVRFRLVGARPDAPLEGKDPLAGKAHYLLGNDPSRWRTDVPLYRRVRQGEIYPGVSLTYYGDQRQLEYDFEVAPGADPRAIRLRVEGAKSLRIDPEGNLVVRTRHGDLLQKAPLVYQVKDGVRQEVPGRFRLHGRREIAFEIPDWDRSAALVIDPVVIWSVYLGGDGDESAEAVAVEDRGTSINTYVTGSTFSTDFPLLNFVQGNQPGEDAFVTRFQYTLLPVALNLFYSTYLGGNGVDVGRGIAVDNNSQAYVTGSTTSANFPRSTGPLALLGPSDAFVTKLFPTGSGFTYTRFLGGNGADTGHDIAVDNQFNAYIVGETQSATGFPVTGFPSPPFPMGFQGGVDGFFTQLDASGSGATPPFAQYSTHLGGSQDDVAYGVALRDQGPAFVGVQVVGRTRSTNFPTKAPVLQAVLSGPSDAFVTEFGGTPGVFSQTFGTFLGGSGDETAYSVDVVDSTTFTAPPAAAVYWGVYVAGETSSLDFPVRDAYQPTRRGGFDAFATKLPLGGGTTPLYSTYFGGTAQDSASGIAVDRNGFAFIAGTTQSSVAAGFPIFRPLPTGGALQGVSDAFVAKLVPTGCSVMFSTYRGGGQAEAGNDIDVAPGGEASVVGRTSSNNFPITLVAPLAGANHAVFQGGTGDAFLTALTDTGNGDVELTKTDSPDPVLPGQNLTYTLTLRNLSTAAPVYGITLTDNLPPSATFVSVTPSGSCSHLAGVVTCSFPCLAPSPGPGDVITVVITVTAPATVGTITNNANVTTLSVDPPGNNADSEQTTVASTDLRVTKTVNPVYPTPVPVGGTVTYTVTVRNNGPSNATNVQVTDTMPPGIFYVSATGPFTCTPPPASVVTCTLPTLTFFTQQSFQITGQATAPGVQTNEASGTATEPDPNTGDNLDTANTLVTVPGTAVLFPTVRSSGAAAPVDPANQNFLEWLNPGGPATQITIHRTTAPGLTPCAYETNSGNGATRLPAATRPFVANQKESFLDDEGGVGLTNLTTYCYTVFVDGASPRFISGRPFDSVSGGARWAFNMGTWSMAPPGNGAGMVHAVSNDSVLYAMTKGGAVGGRWPGPAPQWLPFGFMAGPSQGRPSTYPLPVGTAPSAVFMSSQDGNVYAVNSVQGGGASPAWPPAFLGTTAVAHPSAMFKAFGGAEDLIYAASRETPPTGSQFVGLRLSDGTTAAPGWAQAGGGANGLIGPVHGQPAVDYFTSPPKIYFATRAFGAAPDDRTLWCLNAVTGAVLWAKPYGDIDAGVTLRGNRLYIATNSGSVQAVDTSTGDPAWMVSGPFPITPAAEGPAKGFVYAPPGGNELFFATKNRIWSLGDGPVAYADNWPGGIPVDSPATPIKVPGETLLYVGSGDGTLQRRDAATGFFFDAYFLGDLKAAVGSPTFDLSNGFIYVGTEAGIVYALNKATSGTSCVFPATCATAPDGFPCASTAPFGCVCSCFSGVCVGGC